MKEEVKCNACGKDFPIKLYSKTDGELEATVFRCPHCNMEFVASVTDAKLRRSIERYSEMSSSYASMIAAHKRPGIASSIALRTLMSKNINRSRELKEQWRKKHGGL